MPVSLSLENSAALDAFCIDTAFQSVAPVDKQLDRARCAFSHSIRYPDTSRPTAAIRARALVPVARPGRRR